MILKLRVATKLGYELYKIGGVCDLCYPTSTKRRSRSKELGQIAGTITVVQEHFVIEERKDMVLDNGLKVRIRRLTPRECWRLMGFTDEDFEKAQKVNSDTQLYKQAGNSICVNVLEEIFKQMIPEGERKNE